MGKYDLNAKDHDAQTSNEQDYEVDFNNIVIPYDNILQRYDSVSWRFRLYSMHKTELYKYQTGVDTVKKVVISETGGSGKFSIDEVRMTQSAPCQTNTKNGSLLTCNITLSEQGSLTLFDQLQALTQRLQYKQVMNIPLFLELSFMGYDRYGEHQPMAVPGTTRTWRLHINDIKTQMENSGGTTVYNLECAPSTLNTPKDDWRLTESIEMVATSNVGKFIQEFEKRVNSIADSQYGYLTQMFPNELQPNNYYKFFVHPTIADMLLINDSAQDAAKDKSSTGEGTKKFVFSPELTVGNAIDHIMDAVQSPDDTGTKQKRQFVNVVPIVYYVGFDKYRKKHTYRYEIYLLPYTILDVQDVDDTRTKATAFHLRDALLAASPTTKLNIKRYDYQWSGLNTEILDLNMDFNTAYVVTAQKNASTLFDSNNRKGEKRAEMNPVDQITSGQWVTMYERKKELDTKDADRGLTSEEVREQKNIDNSFSQASQYQLEGSDQKQTTDVVYLEDLSDVDATDVAAAGLVEPVTVAVEYTNQTDTSSSTDDSNASQTEVMKRMARSNIYSRSFMMKVDMQVVGDPYWLGRSDLDVIQDIKKLASGGKLTHSPTALTSDPYEIEPCFLLNIHPTKGYDYKTGLLKTDADSMFSQSIYRLNKVESIFDDNGFTQNLEANIVTRSLNRKR